MYVFPPLRLLGVLVLGAVLTACGGGGGGGGSTTNGLALSLTPTAIKTFHFSWTDVADETEYRLLEDPDGATGYTQVATLAADTTSHDLEVFLPARVNARYILQACNSGGCEDSAPVYVSGTLAAAVGYVKASNTDASDSFGISVALSGDGTTLAVGARFEDSNATGINNDGANNDATDSGAVYVFIRSGTGTWLQQAYVKASITVVGDRFGYDVALSVDGNTLAVGAYGEASFSGAVYVYTRSGTDWTQQAYVKASNTEANDGFGVRVALSDDGDTLAVGAVGEDSDATGINNDGSNNSAPGSGAVYVFTRSGTDWTQQAYVKASNTGADDVFGWSIALSSDGNTLAVAAYREGSNATGINQDGTNNDASNSGAVYVYTRSGTVWSQQAYIKASNTGSSDEFGYHIALSGDGDTLAVGAHFEGSSVAGINNDGTNNAAIKSGAVYVYTRSGTAWTQQAYVKASNTDANDEFGFSVALSGDGNTLAVGARYEDSNATGINGNQADNSAGARGAVYVYTRSGTAWTQQAYLKASNDSGYFGYSVALAGDGATLAVGATDERSNATGIGGDQNNTSAAGSGAVYLY
jgi:hypothetical protein